MRGSACNSQLCIRHGNARFAKHKSHFHHCLNPTSLVKKAREKSEHRESSWLVRWLFCGPMAVLRNSDCSGCWNLTGWLEPPSQWLLLVGAVGRRHSYPGFLRGELVIKCEKGAHQAYLIYTVVVLLGFLSTLMYTSGIPRHTIFFSRDGWGRLLGASAPGRSEASVDRPRRSPTTLGAADRAGALRGACGKTEKRSDGFTRAELQSPEMVVLFRISLAANAHLSSLPLYLCLTSC